MGRRFNEVDGDDVLVGSVVADRYHVAGILGHGTTGTVFGVEHIHFGRRAAMKVLRPRFADSEALHRVFHGDARAAWSVVHPCLAEVFDIGTLPDGSPFFVTEYLEGETLAKRMARERLSLAAAVDVMMQLLSAIDAIHARALLLRELHPENVFLVHRRGCRPIAKILDFGLARLAPLERLQEEWDAPAESSRLDPCHYVSPERTRSEHGVEPASDLFVASAIFYEALTGRRPFTATSFGALMLQIAQATPAPVTELREDVPLELDAFVRRGLSGNPRSRAASAKEMQDELRQVFEGTRRSIGSAAHATAPPPAPSGAPASLASAVPTPREETLVAEIRPAAALPMLGAVEDGDGDGDGDLYADQTKTNHRFAAPEEPAEEQTETMQLTPELRARLEQLSVPPSSIESVPPPPTHRLDKPR